MVQAKRYSKNVRIDAVQQAVASIPYYFAHEAWVITNRGFTEPAKQLAKSNKVKLIARAELIDIILHMNPEPILTAEAIIAKHTSSALSCEKCGSVMTRRKGPRGEFYGCSSFPRCRNTKPV